ncbi:hypothetical protein AB0O68_30560 [Streptomyces sp. NPDC087512]|uniref:hypothetical protein n=1 Tax=Streptomyces sp. NPDC087512 TaxID=3155059 RepID=UPI003437F776
MRFESAGGVEDVQQVREGAEADLLVLAEGALVALAAKGLLLAGTVPRCGSPRSWPPYQTEGRFPHSARESDLWATLLSATRIAYPPAPAERLRSN